MLKVGELAPDFELADSVGGKKRLSSLRGKKVVLYFYPKDDTPGCTLEAVDFTARKALFDERGVEILGISADSEESHKNFCEKHSIGITLLSDPEHRAIEPFGVWQEKNRYGKKYMGIVRTTYLIGADGRVVHVWENVKADGHAEQVLAALDALSPAGVIQ